MFNILRVVLKLVDTLQNELALNLQTQSSIHPGKGLTEDKNTFVRVLTRKAELSLF